LGHVNFLSQCQYFGKVTVSLNTDEFIEEFKGRPPIMTYHERAVVLRSCKYVDQVVPNEGGADSSIAIKKVQPDIIAIGTDWHGKDYLGQLGIDTKFLRDNSIYLVYIPYTEDISTTDIRKRLNEAGNRDQSPKTSGESMARRAITYHKDFFPHNID